MRNGEQGRHLRKNKVRNLHEKQEAMMTFRRINNNKFVGEKESEDDIFEGKFVCEI